MSDTIHGQCLCGRVSFEIAAHIDHVDACHCSMCQHWSGSAFIGASVSETQISFDSETTLSWYDSSPWAKRGFCSNCGSSLFYKLTEQSDFWAVAAGALNLTGTEVMKQEIFIDEKPGYYELAGDHPRLTGEEAMAAFKASMEGQS
ncbi:MAG: hypothetical protein CMK07_12240 [Ponticaulis sp.]|nr:hypothetical protein [Ponticaulis sp.]